jgi:hypothetical protein
VTATDVETDGEALVTLDLGVDMVEGPLWGPFGTDQKALTEKVDGLASAFKAYAMEKKKSQTARAREQDRMMGNLLRDLSALAPDRFGERLAGMVRENPGIECLFVLDKEGVQETDTVWNSARPTKPNGLFRPARKGADHSLKDYCYLLADDFVNRYRTEPYVSQASGHLCVTLSGLFRDTANDNHILCVDVPIS